MGASRGGRKFQAPRSNAKENSNSKNQIPNRFQISHAQRNFVASKSAVIILKRIMQSLARMASTNSYAETLELPLSYVQALKSLSRKSLAEELAGFREFGQVTRSLVTAFVDDRGNSREVPTFVNEFWTAKQRQAHSLHEISYRACFKPQLPRFFIERLTRPGEVVYDPFMGRGTTLVEAALMGRRPCGCDVNPLSAVLCEPRLRPPSLGQIEQALDAVNFDDAGEMPDDLLVFYHPETLRQISALRKHLLERDRTGTLTNVDRWIRMVAVNRLTGHSTGFFSVYTLPPNQAVSSRAQAKINSRLNQSPPLRHVPIIILSKSRALLRDVTAGLRGDLAGVADSARIVVGAS